MGEIRRRLEDENNPLTESELKGVKDELNHITHQVQNLDAQEQELKVTAPMITPELSFNF